MLNFLDLFNNSPATSISIWNFIICIVVALIMGLLLAFIYTFKNRSPYTKSFAINLALFPAIVSLIIMMVNGNLGAGVAVAGAFGLVRFRSAPGSAKEIGAIFIAMATGLTIGMGYIGYAFIFVVILGVVNIIYNVSNFAKPKRKNRQKTLIITIPEDLNYTDVFDDVFKKYTTDYELINVKTTNMGSLFKLTYDVSLIDVSKGKEFIDELRCRNGNLEIILSMQLPMPSSL